VLTSIIPIHRLYAYLQLYTYTYPGNQKIIFVFKIRLTNKLEFSNRDNNKRQLQRSQFIIQINLNIISYVFIYFIEYIIDSCHIQSDFYACSPHFRFNSTCIQIMIFRIFKKMLPMFLLYNVRPR